MTSKCNVWTGSYTEKRSAIKDIIGLTKKLDTQPKIG